MYIVSRLMLVSTLSAFYMVTVDLCDCSLKISQERRTKDGFGRLRGLFKRIRPTHLHEFANRRVPRP